MQARPERRHHVDAIAPAQFVGELRKVGPVTT